MQNGDMASSGALETVPNPNGGVEVQEEDENIRRDERNSRAITHRTQTQLKMNSPTQSHSSKTC